MNGRKVTTITAATAMTVSLGLGVGGGLVSAEVAYNAEMDQLENDQAEQANIREDQLEFDRTRDEIAADLGEVCSRLVVQYSPNGGVLADTSEDVVVRDLLQTPGQPCGEAPTDVRAAVRSYIGSELAIVESESRLNYLEETIDELQENPEGRGNNQMEAILGFGGGGLFVGGLAGFLTYALMKVHYDYVRFDSGKRTWERGPLPKKYRRDY